MTLTSCNALPSSHETVLDIMTPGYVRYDDIKSRQIAPISTNDVDY
jgi:hypothetical protein